MHSQSHHMMLNYLMLNARMFESIHPLVNFLDDVCRPNFQSSNYNGNPHFNQIMRINKINSDEFLVNFSGVYVIGTSRNTLSLSFKWFKINL